MTRVHGSLRSRIQLWGNTRTVLESNHIGTTIIILGFSNFAIDSFINEIYFAGDIDDSLYSLNSYPHRGTSWGGGGAVDGTPLEILICCSISKRFYLQWKAFDLLYKMRYILWVVALLGACDVTNNGRHLGRLLGFYQRLEIKSNPREMVIFCAWHEK